MGRANNRIENDFDLDIDVPKKKGTSYQRKQKDAERAMRGRSNSKHSKRLQPHSDSERARSAAQMYKYMSGNYDPDDDY